MINAIISTQDFQEDVVLLGKIQVFESRDDFNAMRNEVSMVTEEECIVDLVELNNSNIKKLRNIEATDGEGRGIDDIIEEFKFNDKLDEILNDYHL